MPAKTSIACVLALAGCAAVSQPDPSIALKPGSPAAPLAAVPHGSYRTGPGVIQSVVAEPSESASAGGSAPRADGPTPIRLILKMDDGSTQTIWQDNPNFFIGDRVQVTGDGRVVRP